MQLLTIYQEYSQLINIIAGIVAGYFFNYGINKSKKQSLDIDNVAKIIKIYKEENEMLIKQIEKNKKRIGYLEGKLRETTFINEGHDPKE